MLRSANAFRGTPVVAADGRVGSIVDVYFDDRRWCVRYFVLDTGAPMPRRRVLVSPAHGLPGDAPPPLRVRLSRDQLAKCSDADEDKPVYLQHDIAAIASRGDPHLRSYAQVSSYSVRALDAPSGRIADMLVDIGTWQIERLVVVMRVWLTDEQVLVAPGDVESIDWIAREVRLRVATRNRAA
jgi:hypothetical protein